MIANILHQLFKTKYEATTSFVLGNFCTFLNFYFDLNLDLEFMKYLPTLIGTAVPVLVAAYISFRKYQQEREHKEEMHTLDLLKEMQKHGLIERNNSREEIKTALREFGAEIKDLNEDD